MGRVSRERKRRKRKSLATTEEMQSINNDPTYIDISKSLRQNGWRNETLLRIGEFAMTGRGVYSTKRLSEMDLIISLPIQSMISIVTMERDNCFRQLMNSGFEGKKRLVTSQSLLAIYLLFLKHHRRKLDYINTVPSTFSTPYFCTATERSHMIGTIMEKIANQRQTIQHDFECFQHCFGQLCCSHCNRKRFCDIFTLVEFEWAFFAVNSRSVYFSDAIVTQMNVKSELRSWLKDEPTLALAPFLDLLNHSSEAKTNVQFKITSAHGGQYELYNASVTFQKYEQIFISYGALDNFKLLTEYGFFLPNNPNDFIEISATKETCIGQYINRMPYKMQLFVKNNNFDTNLFISRTNGFSHNLKLLIYIICNGAEQETFHENEFKKTIYGDLDKLDITSMQCRNCAVCVIESKIQEMESSRHMLNKLTKTTELSGECTLYCDYLLETSNWLVNLRDVTASVRLRAAQI